MLRFVLSLCIFVRLGYSLTSSILWRFLLYYAGCGHSIPQKFWAFSQQLREYWMANFQTYSHCCRIKLLYLETWRYYRFSGWLLKDGHALKKCLLSRKKVFKICSVKLLIATPICFRSKLFCIPIIVSHMQLLSTQATFAKISVMSLRFEIVVYC